MPIRFKGDMSKIVAKNKGDMTKTTLRRRVASIVAQLVASGGGAVADYYTKLLLHFNDAGPAATTNVTFSSGWSSVLSVDETKLYVGKSNGGIVVLNAADLSTVTTITAAGQIAEIVRNSAGTRLYALDTQSSTGVIHIIDTQTNTNIGSYSVGDYCPRIAITPDDKFLYAQNSGSSGTMRRIDLTTGQVVDLTSYAHGGSVLAISPDGTKMIASVSNGIRIYSINKTTGNLTSLNVVSGFGGRSIGSLSANCDYVYSTNALPLNYTPAEHINVFSWVDLTVKTSITITNAAAAVYLYRGVISPDGKKLYVGSNASDNTWVSVIDTKTNKYMSSFQEFGTRSLACSSTKLFSAFQDAIKVYAKDVSSFSDDATSPLLQYPSGTVSTSATQSKFGGKSLALNGTNTNKLALSNAKRRIMDLQNKPFCVEGWFYLSGWNSSVNTDLLAIGNNDSGDCQGLHINIIGATGKLVVFLTSNGTSWDLGASGPAITTTTTPALNSWFHVALFRETTGGDIKLAYNGTVIGTKSTTASLYTGDYLYVGRTMYQSSTKMDGYVDDIHVTVGSSPYTGNFTPPSAQLTATTNTTFLLNGENGGFIDVSTSGTTVRAYGSAALSNVQKKFGDKSIKISSATGDFVKINNLMQPVELLDRPFTIEGWFWLNANNVGYQPLICMASTGDLQGPVITLETNNTLYCNLSNAGTSWNYSIGPSTVPTANAWHHVAVCREVTAGPIKFYYDGTLIGTNNTTASIFTSENIWIGHYPYYPGGARTLNGYVDDVRILVGASDYVAKNFTVPSTAFANDYNCHLHFEGANGSTTITDSSASPKTFTAHGSGTAISTTKSKFGGSSLYLPGTRGSGSRVQSSNSAEYAFGTGDFTIECWINMSALSSGNGPYYSAIFDTRSSNSSGAGIVLHMNSSSKLVVWAAGASIFTGTTTISPNTWYHVAVTRFNNKLNLFINGVLETSATVSFNATEIGLFLGSNIDWSTAPGMEFNGYIDEFRLVKGTALYGNISIPPTAPFTVPFTP